MKTQACSTVVGEAKCNYLTSVQQSPAVLLLKYFVILLYHASLLGFQICVWAQTYMFLPRHDCDHTIITCQGANVSGHKHVWAKSCLGTNVCGHNCVWAQTCVDKILCLGTNMSGHNRVWAHSCLGTIVSGHNRVWAQSCLGTIVSGHNRVGTIVWSPEMSGKIC